MKQKTEKKNALTKEQHGQILVSTKWFKKEYPNYKYIAVSVHPNITATKDALTDDRKALTFEKLNELKAESRQLFEELCQSYVQTDAFVERCKKLLVKHNLNAKRITGVYLLPFELGS